MVSQGNGKSIHMTKTVKDTPENSLEDALKSTGSTSQNSLNEMQHEMRDIFEILLEDNQNFDSKEAFRRLRKYINNYERILYSTVSHSVYDVMEKDSTIESTSQQDVFGTLLSNIEKLVEYVDDEKNISACVTAASGDKEKQNIFDTKKAVWKIWDHVNLAHRQYDELRQTDSEYDEKFEKRISKFQSKITGEMNAQLLSMVGIFTALAFILFGGISSLENLVDGLRDMDILKLLIIACGWGLGILNVTFVFLFCIGKMTKLNFKSTMSPYASFWQRYPIVCWTDFILISLLCLLGWMYYCFDRGGSAWIDCLVRLNPPVVSCIGFVIILIVILIIFRILVEKTKAVVGDEDE